MNRKKLYAVLLLLAIALTVGMGIGKARAENMDPDIDDSQYAYAENVGWLNFEPNGDGGDGAEVTDSQVTGYVWAENIGWINLSPASDGGVVNDGNGNLSGYAWGENVGWINFGPTNGGVIIDANGDFDGWAWGENIGWIHFRNDAIPYKAKTAWTGNTAPISDAGNNITIASKMVNIATIQGTATDADQDPLEYRWLEGSSELLGWTAVTGGACPLSLAGIPFTLGQHTLILEVRDDKGGTFADDMLLTVGNSAPNAVATGGGIYNNGDEVSLGGQVSDYDGNSLTYEWWEGSVMHASDSVNTIAGGTPVNLLGYPLYPALGDHTYTLKVSDGINDPVTSDIAVSVVDSTAPTLAPVSNKSILWPPNGKMIGIVIEANASDDMGEPVTLSAVVSSNEAVSGLWNRDIGPDWTEPVIDQNAGTITLQLRAERDGSGDGRVYTITITATDDSGNSSQTQVEILVPHDEGKRR